MSPGEGAPKLGALKGVPDAVRLRLVNTRGLAGCAVKAL
jgi:hypothetical protein